MIKLPEFLVVGTMLKHPDKPNAFIMLERAATLDSMVQLKCTRTKQVIRTQLRGWEIATGFSKDDIEAQQAFLKGKYDLPAAEAPTAFQGQVGGEHYVSMPEGYQPFQISKALNLNPVEHTILKYLLRHRGKNGKQDLEKIRHCLDILIEQEYPNDKT